MVKKKEFQTVIYEYVSSYEMMQHIKVMSDSGYVLIHSSHITYTAEYRKDLP